MSDTTEPTDRLSRALAAARRSDPLQPDDLDVLDSLDGLDRGEVLAAAWSELAAQDRFDGALPANLIRARALEGRPRFRAATCLVAVEALVRWAQRPLPDGLDRNERRIELALRPGAKDIVAVIARCVEPWPDGLADTVRPVVEWAALRAGDNSVSPSLLALAALAGPDLRAQVFGATADALAGSPMARLAWEEAVGWGPEVLVVAAHEPGARSDGDDLAGTTGRRPADLDQRARAARTVLEAARRHIQRVQNGEVPYQSDKAFDTVEGPVVGDALAFALARDEPWLPELIEELLVGVTVAPTSARTCPSQSAAIALAHAVAAHPTPESVLALRSANRQVRHAGLGKKLARDLRAAERNLAGRPEMALRLPPEVNRPTKAQLRLAAKALEGGFVAGTTYQLHRWASEVATAPALIPMARSLVWQIDDGSGWRDVMPAAGDELVLTDSSGAVVPGPPGEARVRLWHPAAVDDEARQAWRDRVVADRQAQPLRQVFREHYEPPEGDSTDEFAGYRVSLVPLIGTARAEGWAASHHDECLRRPVGPVTVELTVTGGGLYPGSMGTAVTGPVRMVTVDGGGRRVRPVPFTEVTPVVVSEALRAVDLLVSVAGFGLEEEVGRREAGELLAAQVMRDGLSGTARARRDALRRIVGSEVGGRPVRFGARHLHVGRYAVHLATARVTHRGDPIDLDLPARRTLRFVPWLPYDEELLERIVGTVELLASLPPEP